MNGGTPGLPDVSLSAPGLPNVEHFDATKASDLSIKPIVPETHQVLPLKPKVTPQNKQETKQARQAKAQATAINKLQQKNRKSHTFTIVIPFNPVVQAGVVYKLTGFTPDADTDTWLLYDVAHRVQGKSGSITTMQFHHAASNVATPGPATLPVNRKPITPATSAPAPSAPYELPPISVTPIAGSVPVGSGSGGLTLTPLT
jgi:hypothetical protein